MHSVHCLTLLLPFFLTSVTAHDPELVKSGLRQVANHQDKQRQQHKKAIGGQQVMNAAGGLNPNAMYHAGKANQAKDNNNNILEAVGQGGTAHRSRKRDAAEEEGEFELLGRDDTHEYFKREIPFETLYARTWENDFEDLYY